MTPLKPEITDKKNFCTLPEFAKKPLKQNSNTGAIVLLCIALIVITLAVYMQVGSHEFLHLDDDVYVTANTHVAGGITGKNIVWAFTSVDAANWHPITWLSHMADVQLYGMNPRGHHLTNVAIHTLSALLLFSLLLRLTGALWQSIFVAALFALHPLHVESVAWVAERKDVLSAFFGFLVLLIYSEYVKNRNFSMYLLSFFSFALGLMSKPMLVTLPIIMLLMDYWPLNRYRREAHEQGIRKIIVLAKEKTPFFACSLFSGIITIYAQHNKGAMSSLDELSFISRIENSLIAYVKYIIKTLWPHDLAVLYPISSSFSHWQIICSLIFLLLVSVTVIWIGGRHPYLPVGWFWFLITLLPVIGIIQVGGQSMADRYSYIPHIGLFIIAAWGVTELTKGLQHQAGILALLAGAVITTSTVLSWQQLGFWRNDISLYRHTLEVTTNNHHIHYNLGVVLAQKGDFDAAIVEYREVLRISPADSEAHYNLGIALANRGNLDTAIQEFQKALRINPNNENIHNNLGCAFAAKGTIDAAIQEFQEVLRINPDNANARSNLKLVFVLRKKQYETGK